jgi:NAD dependent epimerase/dehydratase family enzyme
MLPIGVPAFLMKLMLGEMSEMLLNGVNTNAEKLKSTGFEFEFEEIEKALS